MFEVDWADYESERVGERRARKEVERTLRKEENENANNDQLTTSTRSSCPSERSHLSFFGSIGKKKAIANLHKSKKEKCAIPESTKADARIERDLISPQISTESREASMDNPSTGPESKPPNIPPPIARRTARDDRELSWPESPDRSSKESMLSKMTQLTIPTQGEGPVAETAFATTRLVQVLQNASPFSAKPAGATSGHGWVRFSSPTQTGDGPSIAASPRTPRIPRLPPSFQSPTSLDGKSASEFIDDWFTALRRPTYQLPQSEVQGTIRRGDVLLPPNLHPVPPTPTRHRVKKDFSMTPEASPIRFLAHNPDDWKPVAEWNRTHSTSSHASSSTNHWAHPHEIMKAPNTMAADMEAMRIREAVTKRDNTLSENSEFPCAPEGQIAQYSDGPVYHESGVLAECNSSKTTAV